MKKPKLNPVTVTESNTTETSPIETLPKVTPAKPKLEIVTIGNYRVSKEKLRGYCDEFAANQGVAWHKAMKTWFAKNQAIVRELVGLPTLTA